MSFRRKAFAAGVSLASLSTVGIAVGQKYIHEKAGALPVESPEAHPYSESLLCFAEYPDCTRDVGAFAVLATGNQIEIPLESVSPKIIDALISTEDTRFWKHNGIDDIGIARAVADGLVDSITSQELTIEQGASTIDMQTARNLFPDDVPANDLERKKWEWGVALKLNETYTKEEILEKYLNIVGFGRGAYGIEAGAQVLFNKTAAELNVVEAATAVAMVQGPNLYDGDRNPEKDSTQRQALLERRNKVLGDMYDEGKITKEEFDTNVQIPLESYLTPYHTFGVGDDFSTADFIGAHHVANMIIDDVQAQTGYSDTELREGFRINTTISLQVQGSLADAARNAGEYPRDGRQIAAVAIGKDGDVLALYGGDYAASQVNLATAPSPTGSGDKPWFYLDLLRHGIISADQTFVEPSRFVWEGGGANGTDYVVETGDHCSDKQHCPLSEALAKSSNMVLLQQMENHPESLQQSDDLMTEFGIQSDTPAVPAIVLGAREASLYDRVTGMNNLVANHGARRERYVVNSISQVDESGAITVKFRSQPEEPKQIVPVETANIMIELLRGVREQGGTAGKNLKDIPTDIAGKTGTHDNNDVAAFYGSAVVVNPVTKQTTAMTVGVLERYVDKLDSLGKGQTGGNVPATIFGEIVKDFLPQERAQL